jgi:hypothetical protein
VNPNQFSVIGPCYIHGAMYGEGLLGPLPQNWHVEVFTGQLGQFGVEFVNSSNSQRILHHPLLGPALDDWEELSTNRTPDDPAIFARFRNRNTGEVINSDPRFLPEALRGRGILLTEFDLI